MHLTFFGGSGRTGRLLVEQALAAGHDVTVLVRDSSKLLIQNSHLTIITGDAKDAAQVEQAIAGAEAVLSVLGASRNAPTYVISTLTQNILDGMKKQGVCRLVMSTGAGVRDPKDAPGLVDHLMGRLLSLFARYVYEDMTRATAIVRASSLDWTVVRVPMLTDQPGTGTIQIGYLGKGVGPRISRADMAAFMLRQVTDQSYVHAAPAISN